MLLESGCVGGKKRKWAEIWMDREFCGEIVTFLFWGEAGGAGSSAGAGVGNGEGGASCIEN